MTPVTGERRPRPYTVLRALLRPLRRTLPWPALAATGGLGLLLAGLPRLLSGAPDPWLCLNLLRASGLCFALGLAFLFDDPARHTTAPVPVGRPLRGALRLALAAPVTALCWAAALLLVPGQVRPPVGALTLEAAAIAALALAGASAAVRFTDGTRPGAAVAAALATVAVTVPTLLLPQRWALLVTAGDRHWADAHERWAGLLLVGVAVAALCAPEPLRRGSLPYPRRPRERAPVTA
ncbi:ABC transporter [Streptomyces sp. NPDC059766]|uniref:ABC transporter n=1 Tax=Streptomyces sp. NPDC059766 TaxID=3346940 RepID=UPI00364FE5C6